MDFHDVLTKGDIKIWCSKCTFVFQGPCEKHGLRIVDAVVPRAISSLPTGLKIDGERPDQQVIATVLIQQLTIFGPLIGVKKPRQENVSPAMFSVCSGNSIMDFDLEDDNLSNWMKFVRQADIPSEQNLIAYEQNGEIYFSTTKTIHPAEELRFWYSTNYGNAIGKELLQPILMDVLAQCAEPKVLRKPNKPEVKDGISLVNVCHDRSNRMRFSSVGSPVSISSISTPKTLPQHFTLVNLSKHALPEGNSENLGITDQLELWSTESSIQISSSSEHNPIQLLPGTNTADTPTSSRILALPTLSSTKVSNLDCTICNLRFQMLAWLDVHKVCHGGPDPTSNLFRQLKCDCEFESYNAFHENMQVHKKFRHFTREEFIAHAGAAHAVKLDSTVSKPALSSGSLQQFSTSEILSISIIQSPISISPNISVFIPQAQIDVASSIMNSSKEDIVSGTSSAAIKKIKGVSCRRCQNCPLFFPDKTLLEIHQLYHREIIPDKLAGIEELFCPACSSSCATARDLVYHVAVHAEGFWKWSREPAQVLVYGTTLTGKELTCDEPLVLWRKCDKCDLEFKDKPVLELHRRAHIEKSDDKQPLTQLICPTCGRKHMSEEKLLDHILIHSKGFKKSLRELKKPFGCDECDRRFEQEWVVRIHKNRVHSTKEKVIYDCDICSSAFKTSGGLAWHKKSTHRDGPREYKCCVCLKVFNTRLEASHHYATHCVDGNFNCRMCAKTYATYARLKTHMEGMHSGTISCDVCGYASPNKRRLDVHMITHQKNFDYECITCGQKFKRWIGLEDHKNVHNPAKVMKRKRTFKVKPPKLDSENYMDFPFHCDHCKLGFILYKMIRIHYEARHPDKSIYEIRRKNPPANEQPPKVKKPKVVVDYPSDRPCDYCGKHVPTARGLLQHITKVHKRRVQVEMEDGENTNAPVQNEEMVIY